MRHQRSSVKSNAEFSNNMGVGRRLSNAVSASVRSMLQTAPRRSNALDTLESRIMMSASDVVINEVMYNSATAESADEYVELYNKGATPVNLNGWKLTHGVN